MFGEAPLLSLLDRQLNHQPEVRATLVRHAGKSVRLRLPIAALDFAISEQGGLAPAHAEAGFAAEITMGPDTLFALAIGESAALRKAAVAGDGLLAADLSAAMARFDWALALRPYLNDILAARAVQAIGGLARWRTQSHQSVGRTLAEYATFETDLLADKHALRRFAADVDGLRDDAARLEARIALLERSRP